MVMALVLNQAFRGRNILRAYLLIPWVLPGFVAYMTWRWFLDPLQGVLNYALTDLGIIHFPLELLGNPSTALGAVIVADVWKTFPFFGVAFLAGLQNIPSETYEAAAVDGANRWQQFRFVTIPGLRHVILVVLMLDRRRSGRFDGGVHRARLRNGDREHAAGRGVGGAGDDPAGAGAVHRGRERADEPGRLSHED
jgi:ABC-type sugar transport system permease subunit